MTQPAGTPRGFAIFWWSVAMAYTAVIWALITSNPLSAITVGLVWLGGYFSIRRYFK